MLQKIAVGRAHKMLQKIAVGREVAYTRVARESVVMRQNMMVMRTCESVTYLQCASMRFGV